MGRSGTIPVQGLLVIAGLTASQALGAISIADYFPLTPDAAWTYEYAETGEPLISMVTRTVLPVAQLFHGTEAWGLREAWDGEFGLLYWHSNASGIRLHRVDYTEEALPSANYLETPLVFLPESVELGATYRATAHFESTRHGEPSPTEFPGDATIQSEVINFESLTTPAGTFPCLKLRITEKWFEAGNPDPIIDLEYTWWLAQGIGIIRQREESTPPEQGERNLTLLSFSIPGLSAPSIQSQPQSQTAQVGAQVRLAVEATGNPPLGYRWTKDGTDLPGETTPNLTFPAVTLADAGEYRVVVSNVLGSVTSDAATLTVKPADPKPGTPAEITGWTQRALSEFDLTFTSVEGERYEIQTATDLSGGDWSPAATVTAAGPVTQTSVTFSSALGYGFVRIQSLGR